MANTMTTYVKICNLNEVTFNKVKELFDTKDGLQVDIDNHFNRLFSTEFDDLNHEIDWEWMHKNIGSKWIRIEYDEYDLQVNLMIESAWSVPTYYLQNLIGFLNRYDTDIVAYGTYEDESYSPVGAFVYAYEYDDIEDYDVDFELMWNDDDYSDRMYDEIATFSLSLYQSYLQVKNQKI